MRLCQAGAIIKEIRRTGLQIFVKLLSSEEEEEAAEEKKLWSPDCVNYYYASL